MGGFAIGGPKKKKEPKKVKRKIKAIINERTRKTNQQISDTHKIVSGG